MNFIQNLQTDKPINAFNENVVEFTEPNGVRSIITVSGAGSFEITAINNYFYFNLKEIFKAVINDKLFSDDYNYQQIERNDNALRWIEVNYRTFDASGFQIDSQNHTYKVSMAVSQIEKEIQLRDFLHHRYNDEVVFDVFEDLPFDLSYYNRENSNNSVNIFTPPSNSLNLNFSQNEDVYRFPLIDLTGHLQFQTENSNYLSLVVGTTSTFRVLASAYDQEEAKINYHKNCGGIYLKWLNVFGGWDYWLFSEKHKVKPKDKSIGEIYTGYDNIQNLNSIKSSLGKTVEVEHELKAEFLDAYQFQKVSHLIFSPKVYMWTGSKFVEVSLKDKTSFVANRKKGKVEVKIKLPKRFAQTV